MAHPRGKLLRGSGSETNFQLCWLLATAMPIAAGMWVITSHG